MGKDFFDGLGEAITKTARELGGRAETLYETQKMKNKIAGEERQIQKIMAELGKIIYKRYLEGAPLEDAQKILCEQIDQRMQRISAYKENLAGVKGRKICPSCGSSVDGDASFCPHCGAACPTRETEAEAGDVVDGTAEEVDPSEDPDEETSCGEGEKASETETGAAPAEEEEKAAGEVSCEEEEKMSGMETGADSAEKDLQETAGEKAEAPAEKTDGGEDSQQKAEKV